MTPTTKRRRTGDGISASPARATSTRLEADDIGALTNAFNNRRNTLLSWFGNEKLPKRKVALKNAIQEMCDSFNCISSAYLSLLAVNDASTTFRSVLDEVCANVSRISDIIPCNASVGTCNPQSSYAAVASRSATQSITPRAPAKEIQLPRGNPLPIRKSKSIVIGPCDEADARYASSAATKEALCRTVDPVALGLQVHRVRFGPQHSVILESDTTDLSTLRNCPKLSEIGLVIKPNIKRKPRIIIHDIPVSLIGNDVVKCLVEQNLTEASLEDFKVIYLYPQGKKKFRSCVIEVNPEHRMALLERKKVNINWYVCRVDDHISITQCFKCSGFGHIAAVCENDASCSFCAGAHDAKDCPNKKALKCVNCVVGNRSNTGHAATDKVNCPILVGKIKQMMSFINYGRE